MSSPTSNLTKIIEDYIDQLLEENDEGCVSLRRKDLATFEALAAQIVDWNSRCNSDEGRKLFLAVLDSWMHRIARYRFKDGIPVVFETFFPLMPERETEAWLQEFLPEWRAVATVACLDPENPLTAEWVSQLLQMTIRTENSACWRASVRTAGEVSALAVSKHGVERSFPVFRPLLDIGRVALNDELKFGTGPDLSSLRQLTLRLVCAEAVKIAEMSAHGDFAAVAGDKVEEMYQCWSKDPDAEPNLRSIRRFCQLLLVVWSNKRKKTSKKWTPRDKKLAEALMTEEDRGKLTFLL